MTSSYKSVLEFTIPNAVDKNQPRTGDSMRLWVDGQCFQTASNMHRVGLYVADWLAALACIENIDLVVSLNAHLADEAIAARRYFANLCPMARIVTWYGTTIQSESQDNFTRSELRHADERILAHHINEIAPDVAICPSPFEGVYDLSSPFLDSERVNCPTACIFHGAIAHHFPKDHLQDPNIEPAYSRRLMAVARYDLVLCDSEFAAAQYRSRSGKSNCVVIGKVINNIEIETSILALRTLCSALRRLPAGGSVSASPISPPSADETPPPRLIMDVASTAQSLAHSGIQRVMRQLTQAMRSIDHEYPHQLVLSYADDASGWYEVDAAEAWAISHDPRNRLGFGENDIHFMFDSSWNFCDIQRPRLRDALVTGQQVVHGIYDLVPLNIPAMSGVGMIRVFSRWFEFVLGYSTGIICISRAVADEVYEVIEALELPRAIDIGFVQLGSDFRQGPSEDGWLAFLGETPTFIMVGTIEPRKGHILALAAFERLWARGYAVNLLIIGKPGWNTRILQERLAFHPETERRLFVRSNVSDAQLHGAYSRAVALIMASYYEGFGLPVVEAGAQGCRVVLSDIPVFREVGKGAPEAFFFRQGDVGALVDVLEQVLATPPHTSQPAVWPDWDGTAQQVYALVLGNRWYKRYTPARIDANAIPSRIGHLTMTGPLDEADRAHALRWVEGPEISEDGRELHFIVGLRNLGAKLWSARSESGGQFALCVGSRIMTGDDRCLDPDNEHFPIPFVLLPGKEILVPVHVSTDWLARGADSVVVEVVQEGVAWFGAGLTIPLWHPHPEFAHHSADAGQISSTLIGAVPVPQGVDLSALHLFMLREPFSVADSSLRFVLFGVTNTSHTAMTLSHAELQSGIRIRCRMIDGTESIGQVVNGFSTLLPGGCGLLLLSIDAEPLMRASHLCVEYCLPSGLWLAAMEDLVIDPSTQASSPGLDLPGRSDTAAVAQTGERPNLKPAHERPALKRSNVLNNIFNRICKFFLRRNPTSKQIISQTEDRRPITREAVIYVFRFLLGRDPESETVIQDKLGSLATGPDLIRDLLASEEFCSDARLDAIFGANEQAKQRLTREAAIRAYRFILDRDPESEAVIQDKRDNLATGLDLIQDLVESEEFRSSARYNAIFGTEEQTRQPITRNAIIRAYRFILGRDPESEAVIQDKLDNFETSTDLIRVLLASEEFCSDARLDAIFGANEQPRQQLTGSAVIRAYRFILDREPESEAVIQDKRDNLATGLDLIQDLVESEEFRAGARYNAIFGTKEHIKQPITKDEIIRAYRFILGRDPESEAVIQDKLDNFASSLDLIQDLVESEEFRAGARYNAIFEFKEQAQITKDAVIRVYTDFIGRDPETEAVIQVMINGLATDANLVRERVECEGFRPSFSA